MSKSPLCYSICIVIHLSAWRDDLNALVTLAVWPVISEEFFLCLVVCRSRNDHGCLLIHQREIKQLFPLNGVSIRIQSFQIRGCLLTSTFLLICFCFQQVLCIWRIGKRHHIHFEVFWSFQICNGKGFIQKGSVLILVDINLCKICLENVPIFPSGKLRAAENRIHRIRWQVNLFRRFIEFFQKHHDSIRSGRAKGFGTEGSNSPDIEILQKPLPGSGIACTVIWENGTRQDHRCDSLRL